MLQLPWEQRRATSCDNVLLDGSSITHHTKGTATCNSQSCRLLSSWIPPSFPIFGCFCLGYCAHRSTLQKTITYSTLEKRKTIFKHALGKGERILFFSPRGYFFDLKTLENCLKNWDGLSGTPMSSWPKTRLWNLKIWCNHGNHGDGRSQSVLVFHEYCATAEINQEFAIDSWDVCSFCC